MIIYLICYSNFVLPIYFIKTNIARSSTSVSVLICMFCHLQLSYAQTFKLRFWNWDFEKGKFWNRNFETEIKKKKFKKRNLKKKLPKLWPSWIFITWINNIFVCSIKYLIFSFWYVPKEQCKAAFLFILNSLMFGCACILSKQ